MAERTYEELVRDALRLTSEARAKLAAELLRSVEPLAEAEIDRLWIEEAERRDRELDEGVPALPPGWTLHRSKHAGEVGYHLVRAADSNAAPAGSDVPAHS